MKKVYLHPEMEIVEIKGQVLLAGSLSISETEVSADDVLAPEFGDDFVVFEMQLCVNTVIREYIRRAPDAIGCPKFK